MTLLINKSFDYQVRGTNFTEGDNRPRGQYTYTAISEALGERHECLYDYFNMELERFPYPDDEFDVVLFCEVIEHLLLDPAFVLAEVHRVLKPGGRIIVTTPNLVRWENFWAIAWGRNISDAYSGYGAYGRHNREYTPLQLAQLMQACGYTNVQIDILNQIPHTGLAKLVKQFRQHWRDNLFAIGTATGRPRYAYPDWLYRSMHACRKIVSPLIIVGENDFIQMDNNGWYPRERIGDFYARWSRQKAAVYLLGFDGMRRVSAQVCGLAQFLGPVKLTIQVANQTQVFELNDDDWHEIGLDIPTNLESADVIDITFSVEHVRIPAHIVGSGDPRELGVMIRQVELCK